MPWESCGLRPKLGLRAATPPRCDLGVAAIFLIAIRFWVLWFMRALPMCIVEELTMVAQVKGARGGLGCPTGCAPGPKVAGEPPAALGPGLNMSKAIAQHRASPDTNPDTNPTGHTARQIPPYSQWAMGRKVKLTHFQTPHLPSPRPNHPTLPLVRARGTYPMPLRSRGAIAYCAATSTRKVIRKPAT